VHRFFAPALDPGDEAVTLPRDEGEHLTRVLRLGIGDTVSVFDGRGHEFLARVTSARRRDVRVQIVSRIDPTAESSVHLTLVQSALKGDRMDEVIRDAVMLGVGAVQPVVTKRSEVTVAALLRGGRVDRWRRVALASAKQSRRAVLPEVRTPLAFDTYLLEPRPALALMLVEPSAAGEGESVRAEVESMRALRREAPPPEAVLLVGPEGGWDAAETQLARSHGVRLISLGPRTLRADAVPVAAISVLQFLWDELS
jgi:16S rRNA (uracil1498-N3)-methyltransferase